MTVILKSNESEKEQKIFYSNFMAFCLLIEGHAIRIEAATSPKSPIIRSVLDRFQSLTTTHVFQCLSNTPQHRSSSPLWALNNYWNHMCPISPVIQLQFVRSSLDFGTLDQRNDLIDFFWKWQDDFLAQYPEGTSLLSVEEAVRPVKRRSEPSYAVWAAAQALHEALLASEKCECEHLHDYSARLALKTFRTAGLGFEDDFDFDMFLALEQFWQEMQVRTVTQSIVKFSINNANSQTPERSPNGRRMRVKELCKVIRKLQDKPSLRLKCMVEDRQLWKLLSEKTNSAIDRSKPPVSLEQFLTTNPRYLNEKTKRILAILLSYAVLHFYGTPWLQPSWGSSNIIFFQTKSSAIPLRPFLQTILRSCNNAEFPDHGRGANEDLDDDSADPDDFVEHHPCPPLVTLATVLIEVYLATPFKMLAERYNVDLANTEDGGPQYLEVLQVFEACQSEIPENSQFRSAVDSCLKSGLWQDENFDTLDKDKLRCILYEEIVRPLEDELSHAFSYISIEELDKIAQDLDFGNWGESIQNQRTAVQPHAHGPETSGGRPEIQSINVPKHPYDVGQPEKPIIIHLPTTMVQNDLAYTRFKFFDDEVAEEVSAKA
jgi:hypothetical protein